MESYKKPGAAKDARVNVEELKEHAVRSLHKSFENDGIHISEHQVRKLVNHPDKKML
ncbi:MAG TPA: hypothetical protein VEC12_04285 [Bacteroidia bacterium]|nr:hypothetical protein [Bacteroidia bacterium]